ncbi:MAG: vWA domain-containing protein [Oscillospiraceae bacterium]
MKKYLSILAAISVVLSLTGCSKGEVNGPTPASVSSGTTSGSSGTVSPEKSGEYTATDIGGTGKRPDSMVEFAVTEETALATDGAMIKGGAVAPTAPAGDIAPPVEEPSIIIEPVEPTDPEIPPQAGLLTGGEWNDNAHWADWNALYSSHNEWNDYKSLWGVKDSYRLTVTVTANGTPLEGALVSCGNCNSAVTNNKGKAYLFSEKMPESEVTVTFQNQTQKMFADWVTGVNDLTLSSDLGEVGKDQEQKSLDFMIMCDTTGSMGDELEYLKVELENIVRKIKSDNANIPVHTSVNFYRDEGDEYVVRQFPFTDDIEQAAKAIREQSANGGGDFPEAVHTALDSAINNHAWSENSVKIMFLVLDAPPHDDAQIIDSVNKYVREAAEKGVRIVPIASSGIDKSTEYLLRTMAFTTGGTYTFLTDDSGVGNSHIKPTVGAYNVEKLSDMMIRIVNSYLA